MIEGKLIRSTLVEFFQEISFYIEQEEFCDNGKKLLISLSRIKNGYCIKKKVGLYSKIARNREIGFSKRYNDKIGIKIGYRINIEEYLR